MNFDLNSIYTIISSVGGIFGIISCAYLLWKKITGKVKILYSYGDFSVESVDQNDMSKLSAKVKMGITNTKNEIVSLTDIIGTLKYNKEKYEKNNLEKKSIRPFSARPSSTDPKIPIILRQNETTEINLDFLIDDVHLPSIDRIGIAHFLGWIRGVPWLVADERELQNNWDNMPLQMLLSVHLNGKEVKQSLAAINLEGTLREFRSKTLNVVEVSRIQNKFLKGEW